MRKNVCAAVLIALAGATSTRAADGKTVRVHVFASAREPLGEEAKSARGRETEAARKRAEQAAKDLDRSLQARHGKQSKDWPEEARRQSEEAGRAALMAELKHREVRSDQKDLTDSASDLTKALRDALKKSTKVALSDSPDEAELTVEVLARDSRTGYPAAAWLVYLKVKPAGWARSSAFADKPFEQARPRQLYLGPILGSQKMRDSLSTLHPYSSREPYWIVRVSQQGSTFKHLARSVAEILAAFCADLAEPPA
jgi:hypothetical protein